MQPWTPLLLKIKTAIEQASGHTFNSVLLNLYRDNQDSMGWHSDDETSLGKNPAIASFSIGATRLFKMKHRYRPDIKTQSLPLLDGTLLVMAGPTQHFWKHAVDKTSAPSAARINLTFRKILRSDCVAAPAILRQPML